MRCHWVDEKNELYVKYHDEEWGVPIYDDKKLFEMLMLESFQAGLSWLTVLKKRSAFRTAYDDFDFAKIAVYDENKVAQLLKNPAIIRSRSKINATVNNARIFLKIRQQFGSFSAYIWQFTNGKTVSYHKFPCPTENELSQKISVDLRKRGMKYVGSIIIYSYLQAVGIIDDHEPQCYRFSADTQKNLQLPKK
jgi:DNA-3-methyladenine glycosylase I